MLDMEHAVQTRDASAMCLGYSRDVMDIMTRLRKEWGMKYPGRSGIKAAERAAHLSGMFAATFRERQDRSLQDYFAKCSQHKK